MRQRFTGILLIGAMLVVGPAWALNSSLPANFAEVRLAAMMAMFRPQRMSYRKAGHWADSSRSAMFMAFDEINNKGDGVGDWLLPRTRLLVAYSDSRCDGAYGVTAALRARDAFEGRGVSGIIGPGCSSAATSVSMVSESSHTPLIAPSATSPTLSDGNAHPYFLRTPPVNTFRAVGIVDLLRVLFNYTEVAVVWTQANNGGSNMVGVREAAATSGLLLEEFLMPTAGTTREIDNACAALLASRRRVVALMLSSTESRNFIYRAYEQFGMGGEQGFLWFGLSSISDLGSSVSSSVSAMLLKGYFAISVSGGQGPIYEAFEQRMKQLPSTAGSNSACDLRQDDDGNYVWAADHDENASTPLACAGDDHSSVSFWAGYAYDAVYAMAHALHDLIEVQNKTEIVGSELLDVLIKRVRFEGVTGLINFNDASADPDRLYHGDRIVGVSYTLLNYVDEAQGLVSVGLWSPCSSAAACEWSERWQQQPGAELTYSTADNSRPPQKAAQSVTLVRIGVVLSMFATEVADFAPVAWSPRMGVFQALRELNNKTDGVADVLLPDTRVQFAFQDSKCDSAQALVATLRLTQDAFAGEGVHAIIGASCSSASISAAQAAAGSRVPIISPTSTSSSLSDGKAFPYFLRTIPADMYTCAVMVQLLQMLFNYGSVAFVHSTDVYGNDGRNAFSDAAFASGLKVVTSLRFAKDLVDFSAVLVGLQQSPARVVVLYCQVRDGSRLLREATEAGVGGDGCNALLA